MHSRTFLQAKLHTFGLDEQAETFLDNLIKLETPFQNFFQTNEHDTTIHSNVMIATGEFFGQKFSHNTQE